MEKLFILIFATCVGIVALKMIFPKRRRINIGQQNDIDHYQNLNS